MAVNCYVNTRKLTQVLSNLKIESTLIRLHTSGNLIFNYSKLKEDSSLQLIQKRYTEEEKKTKEENKEAESCDPVLKFKIKCDMRGMGGFLSLAEPGEIIY